MGVEDQAVPPGPAGEQQPERRRAVQRRSGRQETGPGRIQLRLGLPARDRDRVEVGLRRELPGVAAAPGDCPGPGGPGPAAARPASRWSPRAAAPGPGDRAARPPCARCRARPGSRSSRSARPRRRTASAAGPGPAALPGRCPPRRRQGRRQRDQRARLRRGAERAEQAGAAGCAAVAVSSPAAAIPEKASTGSQRGHQPGQARQTRTGGQRHRAAGDERQRDHAERAQPARRRAGRTVRAGTPAYRAARPYLNTKDHATRPSRTARASSDTTRAR